MGNLGNLGSRTQSSTNIERIHLTFPNQTKLDQVTHYNQLLCTSPQESLPVGGIASADNKNPVELVKNQESLGFNNQLFLVPKPNKWRPILDLSNLNKFLKAEKFKMIRTSLQTGEWVTSIDFKDAHTKPIKEIHEISCTGQNIPIQSTTLWSVHSSIGVHCCGQRGQIDGFTKGYKNPPVPKRLGPGQIPPNLSPAYTNTSSYVLGPRLASILGKIRTEPQAGLRLCRLPVRPKRGQGHAGGSVDWVNIRIGVQIHASVLGNV